MNMGISLLLYIMAVILAGSCIQSALGFGTTMITMGFLPLVMDYSKAMGLSILLVSFSTVYISLRYRKHIQWRIMLPFLIPTAIISGTVNYLSAKVNSNFMYLLLGFMFVAVAIFFFVFSNRIHIRPTATSGTILGAICGVCYGLFASGGPTAALYLLPAVNDKEEYLATIQAFLCVNNLVILTISLLLRRLNPGDLPMIGAGTAALIAGTFLGLYIHKKIPSDIFGKVIYAFVGIGGIWIIVSHLT
ncbi:MAG: sulfite exporter TauE/SafE family protein [Eubacterium sp.]|nr:sulfite exporter TauE/SafE family protein [Eubacterium sp.]